MAVQLAVNTTQLLESGNTSKMNRFQLFSILNLCCILSCASISLPWIFLSVVKYGKMAEKFLYMSCFLICQCWRRSLHTPVSCTNRQASYHHKRLRWKYCSVGCPYGTSYTSYLFFFNFEGNDIKSPHHLLFIQMPITEHFASVQIPAFILPYSISVYMCLGCKGRRPSKDWLRGRNQAAVKANIYPELVHCWPEDWGT